jgi:uncharacterized protein YmfQ (DUF2313 family)
MMAIVCPPPPGDPTPFSDALSAPTGAELLPSIIAQTPRGAAWRTDEVADAGHESYQHRFWRAVADPLADLYAKLWKLALASTGCTLSGPEDAENDALADWEREFGLPEPCLAGVTLSVAQRKKILREKIASQGGQSIAYFVCLARRLGYEVTIRETRLFRCGEGRCGKHPIGGPANEVIWRVYVTSPSVGWFRLGVGRVGRDPLGSFGRRRDLECLFNQWKPAHTQIRFHYVYTGAPPPPFA